MRQINKLIAIAIFGATLHGFSQEITKAEKLTDQEKSRIAAQQKAIEDAKQKLEEIKQSIAADHKMSYEVRHPYHSGFGIGSMNFAPAVCRSADVNSYFDGGYIIEKTTKYDTCH